MKKVAIEINGKTLEVPEGVTVAAALWNAGVMTFRRSASGRPRGPLCGMGVCFECRVTIDGVAQRRACLEAVREAMRVGTGE